MTWAEGHAVAVARHAGDPNGSVYVVRGGHVHRGDCTLYWNVGLAVLGPVPLDRDWRALLLLGKIDAQLAQCGAVWPPGDRNLLQ